jgi:oxygen-independent coproporphyrinogen-3 oxidase
MLGVYVHIPFCRSICSYCNFNRGLYDAGLKARYVDALVNEVARAGTGEAADTIFFGGGTPSLLEAADVRRVIGACRQAFAVSPDAEITLETNPETVMPGRLRAFVDAGVNRFSIGVQSFDDAELSRLDRVHSAARAVEAVRLARAEGVENVSLDLMLWLPGQSRASWRRTVERAVALEPDHLSMYLLELYPNAPLKEAMARAHHGGTTSESARQSALWAQAADDDAADMYLDGLEIADQAGYAQYEISNVAKPGRESRHNLKYWQAGAWRGFGAGAHSTVRGRRWRNVGATADYIDRVKGGGSPAIDEVILSPDAQCEEALFTGLRLSAGIDRRMFQARFGVDPWARYDTTLEPYVAEALMWRDDDRMGLTRRGMLVANAILSAFV